jgi:hypothetical protein
VELLGAARRVPLSHDAAAMSLGHFLEVSFGARHLSVGPRPLHAGYARYFGCGSAVACFLWDRVGPAQVDMPPQLMHYYVPAQQGWIKDEVEELINVSIHTPKLEFSARSRPSLQPALESLTQSMVLQTWCMLNIAGPVVAAMKSCAGGL